MLLGVIIDITLLCAISTAIIDAWELFDSYKDRRHLTRIKNVLPHDWIIVNGRIRREVIREIGACSTIVVLFFLINMYQPPTNTIIFSRIGLIVLVFAQFFIAISDRFSRAATRHIIKINLYKDVELERYKKLYGPLPPEDW